MPSSIKPQYELLDDFEDADFLAVDGWYRVKTATPAVTKNTTKYLYRGKRRRNMVRWRNITGRSLQDLARM